MSTIYTQQSKNVSRTWILMGLFLVVVVLIGLAISHYYNNPGILFGAVIFSILMNVFSYWFSDRVVLSLTGAKKIIHADYPDLFNLVENLSITAGLPMPRVYLIEDDAPNAFATGRNKEKAVVAVTTGLLKLLNRSELEGVIAHELSHIGNRDMLLSTVVVVLVGFVSILSDIFLRGSFSGRDSNRNGGVMAILGLILIILSPLIARLIQLAISRKREYLADADAVLLTRYPDGLANALRKIEMVNIPIKRQHDAVAHLYFSNPAPRFGQKVSSLFSTHPLTEDRIKAILNK